ncbi:MAG: hypothetical protein ACWA5K_04885 [bacterium]
MYTDENYFWGMVTYYVGVALVMAFLVRYRRLVPIRHLRNVLLLAIAVILMTPVAAYSDVEYLAPAWFVMAFGMLASAQEEVVRAQVPLIAFGALAFFGYILLVIGIPVAKRKMHARQQKSTPGSASGAEETTV